MPNPLPNSAAASLNPVLDKRDRKEFMQLAHRLYRDDPAWVAPLDIEFSDRVWGANPYLKRATVRTWLARRGDRTVGRISAQWDPLQQEFQGDGVGNFGLIECENDPDVAKLLFEAAGDWLREQGATSMRGPFNLSVNEECGMLIDGFDTPPSIMMPHGLPYYDALFQQAGLCKGKDLIAYRVAPDFDAPKVMTRLSKSLGDSVAVRPINKKNAKAELETIRDVFNDAWSKNYGFVPFTEEEFAAVGQMVTLLMPADYVQIAEVNGEAAAFIVAMPNINEVAATFGGKLLPFNWLKLIWGLKVRHPRSARVPLMGVRQHFQHSRHGPGLAFLVIDAVRKALCANGVREVELSWILEDNSGMRSIIESIGGEAYKTNRIYEKAL